MLNSSFQKFSPIILAIFMLGSVWLSLAIVRPTTSYQTDCTGLELEKHCFALEVADTNQARIKGLSERDGLPANSGMLFVFESAEEQCFWMRGMRFDLDIIWTNEFKRIVKIKPDVSPDTYPESFCGEDTRYVLEFDAGFAAKHGLKVGDELNF